jgi:hypothetical protein
MPRTGKFGGGILPIDRAPAASYERGRSTLLKLMVDSEHSGLRSRSGRRCAPEDSGMGLGL